MYCRKCGAQNKDDSKFCAQCGEKLLSVSELEHMAQDEESGKNRKRLIPIVVAAVLVIVAIIIVAVLLHGKAEEKNYYEQISLGEQYLEEQNYELALESYLRAIEIDPKQEEPYLRAAQIYTKQKKPEKTVEVLKQGMENTDSPEVECKYQTYSYVEQAFTPELCEEGTYTCQYTGSGYYIMLDSIHSLQGTLAYRVLDFDGDGQDELLAVVLDNQAQDAYQSDIRRNRIALQMYENVDGEMQLAAEYQIMANVLGSGDAENDGLFLKESNGEIYICGSFEGMSYMYADGVSFQSFALTYENGFREYMTTGGVISGSSFEDLEAEKEAAADKLEAIGLNSSAEGIRKDWIIVYNFEDPVDDMLMRITGENTGGDSSRFMRTGNPADLGEVDLTLQLTFEEAKETADTDAAAGSAGASEETSGETFKEETVSTETYQKIYGSLVQQTYVDYGEYNIYMVYDIDKDGVKELLLQTGTCEADYMYQIYTIQDNASRYLGEIPGGHTMFYADEQGGNEPYIIQLQGHMGYETLYQVSIENGAPKVSEISSRELGPEDEYYANPYPVTWAYVSDLSLIP